MNGFEWGAAKAAANLKKHQVDFADAAESLDDPYALTAQDPDPTDEERFLTVAMDPEGRILVTVFSHSGGIRRIISSRRATAAERSQYRRR